MELTKEYFDQQLGNLATKRDLEHLVTQDDVKHFQDDFRVVKSDITEIKQHLADLDKRDSDDSNAFAKTFVKYGERLTKVERDLKSLTLKQV